MGLPTARRSGDAWTFECQSGDSVIGAFDMRRWLAWHDDSAPAQLAFNTIIHEEVHAQAIAGSSLHLGVLSELLSPASSSSSPVPSLYDDYLHFHEAVPKAYDLLTGSSTSAYDDPGILVLASQLADATRRIAEAALSSAGSLPHGLLELIALRGIALAVSDGCEIPEWTSASVVLAALGEILTREPGRASPSDAYDPIRPFSQQIRRHVSDLLGAQLGRSVHVAGDVTIAVQAFAGLAHLTLTPEGRARIPSLLLTLMNAVFPGAATTHLVLNPDTRRLHVATSQSCLMHMRGDDNGAAAKTFDDLAAIHRSRLYDDDLDYVCQGFLVKNVFDAPSVPRSATRAYLKQMWGAFPTAFINVCDAVFAPSVADSDREMLIAMLREQMPGFAAVADHYAGVRDHVWQQLLEAVAHLPYWIAGESEFLFQRYHDAGMMAFDPSADALDFYLGDSHTLRLVPSS